MSKIAIVHPDLNASGGAELVSLESISALTEDHEVTVFTVTDVDTNEITRKYQIDPNAVNFESIPTVKHFRRFVSEPLSKTRFPSFRFMELALFDRIAQNVMSDYELYFSTYNEFMLPLPSIHYIHHPNYYPELFPDTPERSNKFHNVYDDLCRSIAGFDINRLSDTRLLANSKWTAERFAGHYGYQPEVLYPPVNTTDFNGLPWEEREDGFVAITRISPDKCVLDGIKILDELQEQGNDIHLHIIGSITDDRYYRKVKNIASNKSYIIIEGELPREDLTELVGTHKYGLHTKPAEHFGIAVAELVAGGTIPFVPEEGGQQEIVGQNELTWDSIETAVERIEYVLSDSDIQSDLRQKLPDIEKRFGRERFREAVHNIVGEEL